MARAEDLLVDLQERIKGLEQQAELIKTVLIVKEPNTVQASQAYDGLRKQVVAAASERRSHLAQLVAMSVAVSRATAVSDLVPQVKEWMEQAGVAPLGGVPDGNDASHLFEDIGGKGLDGPIEIIEPAYIDVQTGTVLRLGRARLAEGAEATAPTTRETGDNDTPKDVIA